MRFISRMRPAIMAGLISWAPCVFAEDWPQWLGPQGDSIWRETGIVEKFPDDGPAILWRAPVGGGYSGPAVAGGRVYLTDRELASGVKNPSDPFKRGIIPGAERVLCLDEKTGKVLWMHQYDCPYSMAYAAGPRSAPLI